jgi:hypothetical protein
MCNGVDYVTRNFTHQMLVITLLRNYYLLSETLKINAYKIIILPVVSNHMECPKIAHEGGDLQLWIVATSMLKAVMESQQRKFHQLGD